MISSYTPPLLYVTCDTSSSPTQSVKLCSSIDGFSFIEEDTSLDQLQVSINMFVDIMNDLSAQK